jgi:hypothetical protein
MGLINMKKFLLGLAALGLMLSPTASTSQSAFSDEPAVILSNPDPSTVAGPGGKNWVFNSGFGSAVTYSPYSLSDEGAFRSHCDPKFLSWSDPILYPNQPGASHLHQVYGLSLTENEFAGLTYNWGRNKANSASPSDSSCGGGSLVNPTMYWHPALWNGAGKVIVPAFAVIYYKMNRRDWQGYVVRQDNTSLTPTPVRIPRDFSYVFGYDIYNPTPTNNAGWKGWKCESSGGSALWLKNDDGSATLPLTSGLACNKTVSDGGGTRRERLAATFTAPMCWNGTARKSANGRDHVRATIWNGNIGKMMCPTGYPYIIPHFDFIVWWSLEAGEDIRNFYFDSDRMQGHPTRRNGETGHADWFGLWNYEIMDTWMHECIGYLDNNDAKVRSCSSTAFGDGRQGNYAHVTLGSNSGAARLVDPPCDPSTGAPDKVILHTHGNAATPTHTQNKVALEGDSISVYGATMYSGLYQSANPSITVCQLAVGGSTINTSGSTLVGRINGVRTCNGEVVTVLIGANDMLNYSTTQQWLDALWGYTDTLRGEGYKVAVATVLPRVAGAPANQVPFNTRRAEVNTAIRNAVGTHIDAVIDYAANTTIGDDADATDTAKYPDGLHPSDSTHAIMKSIYEPVVNNLLTTGPQGLFSIPMGEQEIAVGENEAIVGGLVILMIGGIAVYIYRTRRREEEEKI